MKVFHFDPQTGRRGAYIENAPVACQLSNPDGAKATLPYGKDTQWAVATMASTRDGTPIMYDFPVCFCVGLLTAGTDSAWHWYALLPAQK